MPAFSILTPTKNRPELLANCLAAVREQTFTDWQHVILDNGVPIKDSLPDDDRITYAHRETRGITHAVNCGLELATGSYLLGLADDDCIPPHALAIYARCFAETGADVVVGGTLILPLPEGGIVYRGGTREAVDQLLAGNMTLGQAVCWRKELSDERGIHDEELWAASDIDFYIRMMTGSRVAVVPDVLYVAVSHEDSHSAQNARIQGEQARLIHQRVQNGYYER